MLVRPLCRVLPVVLVVGASVAVGAAPAAATTSPALGVGDIRLMEPIGGAPDARAAVPVVLDRPATAPVTFAWAVRAGTADGADLVLGSGTGTIAAGQQATSVPVQVRGDGVTETLDQVATVEVSAVAGAGVERAVGRVVIRDAVFDGVPAGFVIGDVTVPEPDSGSVRVAVPVTLPVPAKKSTSLTWELRSQYTARTGEDVAAAGGTLTLPGSTTSGSIPLTVQGDVSPEPLETLLLKPLSAGNAQIGDPWGQVRILRDDADDIPLPWTAPEPVLSGPATAVYLESSIGDWAGQGISTYDTLATAGVKVVESDGELRVDLDGDRDASLRLTTSGDRVSPIVAGAWTVHGYQYGVPGFDAGRAGTSCSSPDATATFVLEDVARGGDGTLDRFVLRFEQFCPDSLDPTRGFVRYQRDDATVPAPAKDPSTYPWQPPAGAVPAAGNWLYLASAPGEFVGQGQTRLLAVDTAARADWSAAGVRLSFGDGYSETWNFLAGQPGWAPVWQPGWYPVGYGAAGNPVKAALSVSGNGRACNKVTGDLVVDTATHDADGALTALTLRFTQLCDDDPDPLRGMLRWSRA
ncbi:hypothetical protein [Micromonospora sp. WMMA1996]|uniref:hypothetical protein n=1 Tax=Micromonospora sp. WMMA1996 TaxID=2039878 RepID=UPI00114578CB|nr:hypothetical protein [Micromonospora sp. WMMA1996]